MKNKITILGIETSCDETAASVLQIINGKLQIVNNVVSSQVKIHAQHGGIVPEVAARKHAENIIGVLEAALNPKFKIQNPKQIPNYKFKILNSVDAIAVTNGPGLITSLLIGVEAAKTLSFLSEKPLIPINHIVAHLYANFIGMHDDLSVVKHKLFPAVCLIVSGGHTELVLMNDFEKFKKIGQTLDDAAGECFDKVAKILELEYPGGPQISALAEISQNHADRNADKRRKFQRQSAFSPRQSALQLPRPMINSSDFNFSFSGLKTSALYKVQSLGFKIEKLKSLFCAEFQQAVIDVLIDKTMKAAEKYQAKSIILGGGVVANKELRKQFKKVISKKNFKINALIPELKYTTDNAAMIAAAGYFKLKNTPKKEWQKKFDWRKIKVDPSLEI